MRLYEAASGISASPKSVRAILADSGGVPLGQFRGVRTYTLLPEADGHMSFHMREENTAPLAAVIRRSMPDLGRSFTRFAGGLKQRLEGGV